MKTKTREITLFDPGSIELTITGAIKKNTLPEVRGAWSTWLDSFNAATLETDQDFTDAAKFVTECKRVEERLAGIREDALKGKIFEAIKELETMGETTRQKRLEFDRAVTQRKDRIKSDAISAAVAKCRAALAPRKYKQDGIDLDTSMRTAIKGKSAILKMQEALDAEVERLVAEAQGYTQTLEDARADVAVAYSAAGETSTDSELDMIVKTYGAGSVERANFILQQKKIARDQAVLDQQKKELEAAKAAPAPIQTPFAPQAQAAAPGATARALRFGATFVTTDPEQTISLINSIGGKDVKFQELKTQEAK